MPASRSTSGRVLALLVTALLGLVAGCAPAQPEPQQQAGSKRPVPPRLIPSASPSPEPSAEAAVEAPGTSYAVTASGPAVAVHDRPAGTVTTSLASPVESGAPLTFLQVSRQGPWLEVLLPVEPNGSKGWVREQEVVVETVTYRLDVRTSAHQMDLFDADVLVRTYPVGIGKAGTPTPGGTFYLKELLRPPNPKGSYGPYAYGLSGFSQTLDSFAGTDPVIGIHGTDDPSSIGKDVSSGCIRVRNADVTELAQLLPLGTPVRILA